MRELLVHPKIRVFVVRTCSGDHLQAGSSTSLLCRLLCCDQYLGSCLQSSLYQQGFLVTILDADQFLIHDGSCSSVGVHAPLHCGSGFSHEVIGGHTWV